MLRQLVPPDTPMDWSGGLRPGCCCLRLPHVLPSWVFPYLHAHLELGPRLCSPAPATPAAPPNPLPVFPYPPAPGPLAKLQAGAYLGVEDLCAQLQVGRRATGARELYADFVVESLGPPLSCSSVHCLLRARQLVSS